MLPINASIIQGSALGPVDYVFTASDLHPTSPANRLCKYADDTYVLVPAKNSLSVGYYKRSNTYLIRLQPIALN